MSLPEGFIFSQGRFQDYLDCQRRFQLRYLIERAWPALEVRPIEEYERLTMIGQKFHQMVHQYILGVPKERIGKMIHEDELRAWWNNFMNQCGKDGQLYFLGQEQTQTYSEISITASIDKYRLIAKYDLLSFTKENQITILDWKTSNKHPGRAWLSKRMQTKIYPYILVEVGSHLIQGRLINAADVEMIYWFANHPDRTVKFKYSQGDHFSIKQQLIELIDDINHKKSGDYMLTTNMNLCRFCNYRSLCERGAEAGEFDELFIESESHDDNIDIEINIEQIAEIEF